MLANIFLKSSQQKILSFFAINPGQSFYVRQLSKKLKISLGAVHQSLSILEKRGILVPQIVGKTKLYRLDSNNPIITTFKILNTLLVLEPLTQTLKDYSSVIILFGSYSTGTFASNSDLDLLIVSEAKEDILSKIDSFERKTQLNIHPLIKSLVEWIQLEKEDPEFFSEIGLGIAVWDKQIDERGF